MVLLGDRLNGDTEELANVTTKVINQAIVTAHLFSPWDSQHRQGHQMPRSQISPPSWLYERVLVAGQKYPFSTSASKSFGGPSSLSVSREIWLTSLECRMANDGPDPVSPGADSTY